MTLFLKTLLRFSLVISLWIPASLLSAATQPDSKEAQPFLPIRLIAPGIYRMGDIQIHQKAMTITFPARFIYKGGTLRNLIVGKGSIGQKSLLLTDHNPYDFHIAFSLLGLEMPGESNPGKMKTLNITIIRRIDNQSIKEPAEMWLKFKDAPQVIPRIKWLYTGSKMSGDSLAAQGRGIIAALINDPQALINITPPKNRHILWEADPDRLPDLNTETIVVIKVIPDI